MVVQVREGYRHRSSACVDLALSIVDARAWRSWQPLDFDLCSEIVVAMERRSVDGVVAVPSESLPRVACHRNNVEEDSV